MKTIFQKTNGVDGIGIDSCIENLNFEGIIPKELIREEPIGLPQLSEL